MTLKDDFQYMPNFQYAEAASLKYPTADGLEKAIAAEKAKYKKSMEEKLYDDMMKNVMLKEDEMMTFSDKAWEAGVINPYPMKTEGGSYYSASTIVSYKGKPAEYWDKLEEWAKENNYAYILEQYWAMKDRLARFERIFRDIEFLAAQSFEEEDTDGPEE